MHVLIVGGHGRAALLLGGLLVAGGHEVTGTYRAPAHAADLSAAGMSGVPSTWRAPVPARSARR